jgi:hypothetical protein
MKHAYSFLAGAALISLCVVATHSLPGWMFLLGYLLSLTSILLVCRVIGFGKVARFFFWLSNRETVFVSCGTGVAARRDVRNAGVPGSHGYANSPVSGKQAGAVKTDERNPVAPFEAAASVITGDNPARQPKRSETPTRCNPSAARNANSRSVVQSREMLPPVQQDVLSALVNLKVPFAHAEQAVHAAAREHGGQSFDELFKIALALVNAGVGKTRRAA